MRSDCECRGTDVCVFEIMDKSKVNVISVDPPRLSCACTKDGDCIIINRPQTW